MGLFDDMFGGLFDFNGDGITDPMEEALGFAILQDALEDDEEQDSDDFPL